MLNSFLLNLPFHFELHKCAHFFVKWCSGSSEDIHKYWEGVTTPTMPPPVKLQFHRTVQTLTKGAQFTTIQDVHFAKFTIMHSSAVQGTQSPWLKSPLTSGLVTTPKAGQVPKGQAVQSLSTSYSGYNRVRILFGIWYIIYSGYNRARVPFRMAANGANGRLRKHGGEKADTAARRKSRIPDRLQDTTLEEKAHKVFFGWQLKKICLGT